MPRGSRAFTAALLFVLACASQQSMTAGSPAMPGSRHDEIARYAEAIDADRAQLGLPAPAGDGAPNASPMSSDVPNPPAPTCARSAADTCAQTCTLSDSICDNANKICTIANQLAADDWAAKKCVDAKSTCGAATRRCCECGAL